MLTVFQRLKNWFYNCRIGKGREDERPTILNLTGRKKRRQLYQAYVKLFGKYVLPVIRAQYREAIKQLPPGEAPPDRLKFMRVVATKMLEGESPEVRAAVENYKLLGEVEEGDEDIKVKERNRLVISRFVSVEEADLQGCRAVTSLPRTIQVICDNIEKETGWVTTVFLGGSHAITGEIMSVV